MNDCVLEIYPYMKNALKNKPKLKLKLRSLSTIKYLKGYCRAIWQLYKKLEGIFASVEFQNY